MPDTTTKNVTLTNGSIEMLQSALNSSGWTSKRREVTAAGQLVDTLESFTDTRPIYKGELANNAPTDQLAFGAFRKEVRAWERAEKTLSITDAQFQACVACLRHYSDEKRLPANIHSAMLLTVFKLTE
jgi:hypothetical protein